jgi:hypothetical protein
MITGHSAGSTLYSSALVHIPSAYLHPNQLGAMLRPDVGRLKSPKAVCIRSNIRKSTISASYEHKRTEETNRLIISRGGSGFDELH